jgi:hypothetical protein
MHCARVAASQEKYEQPLYTGKERVSSYWVHISGNMLAGYCCVIRVKLQGDSKKQKE